MDDKKHMQCVTCKIDLVSLGLTIVTIKMGYCLKCGLVYAQKQAAAPSGSTPVPVKKTTRRT